VSGFQTTLLYTGLPLLAYINPVPLQREQGFFPAVKLPGTTPVLRQVVHFTVLDFHEHPLQSGQTFSPNSHVKYPAIEALSKCVSHKKCSPSSNGI
jgi:hypothetical protein